MSSNCWLAGTKYAMSALGVGNGRTISPLQPASEKQKKIIDEIIRSDVKEGRVKK